VRLERDGTAVYSSLAREDYRTNRVIREIYDELAESVRTGEPYRTHLDPPPGVRFASLAHEVGHLFLGHLGQDKALNVPQPALMDHTQWNSKPSLWHSWCVRATA
jgi:hypothetical protein